MEIAAAHLNRAEARLERLLKGASGERRAELAALCRAKTAELESARARRNRYRDLGQDGGVSEDAVDKSESRVVILAAQTHAARARLEMSQAAPRTEEVRIAKARIQAARARLESAQVQLRRTRLLAPRPGQVLDVDVMVGELTGPNADQPAVVLADTAGSRVRAFADEKDAVAVRIGMNAKVVADGLGDRQLRGTIVRLSPKMAPKRFCSDDPAEKSDVETRQIWIALETTEPQLIGLRVRVIVDASGRVAGDPEPTALASLGPGERLFAD